MKYLFLLLMLIPFKSFAGIYQEEDKNLHLGVSYNLSAAIHLTTKKPLLAFGTVMTLGLIKEFVIDNKPDLGDIHANMFGAGVGAVIPFRVEF